MKTPRKLLVTGGSGFIGTNLIADWADEYEEIINLSIDPPLNPDQAPYWRPSDIMDLDDLSRVVAEFSPTVVVHLAARTDTVDDTTVEKGYRVNTRGTRNLIDAISGCAGIDRLLITSSQFVCRPGYLPQNECDYSPHTVYGESKVQTEAITRDADPDCIWTIIRPTNIWGPWHTRYAREFWRVCARGWYVHPDVPSPVRSYGYVRNVVWQMARVLELPRAAVHRKVFYLGDRPERIDRWVEGFHSALTGRRRMRRVPLWLLRVFARTGDAISFLTRRPFYITSSRLRSMTTDYPTPMEPTFELLGKPPFSIEAGIEETVAWFRHVAESGK